MAKLKVHELAKEFDISSKEVIAYLNGQGIEAKAAMSSVEEDAAAKVRAHFGKGSAPKTTPAKEEVPVKSAAPTKEEAPAKSATPTKEEAPAKSATPTKEEAPAKSAAPAKPEAGKATPTEADKKSDGKSVNPKKKKTIIILNNAGNSGAQNNSGRNNNRGGSGGYNNNRNNGGGRYDNRRQQSNASERRPLIRPLNPPSPTPSVGPQFGQKNQPQPRQTVKPQEQPQTTAQNQAPEAEHRTAPSAHGQNTGNYNNRGEQRGNYGNNRREDNGQRREGGYRGNNAGGGYGNNRGGQTSERSAQGAGGGRYDNNRNRPGDNRNGVGRFNKDGNAAQGNSNRGGRFGNNDRGGSRDGRPNNNFGRPQQGGGSFAAAPAAPAKDGKGREVRNNNKSYDKNKRSRKDSIYEEDQNQVKNGKKRAGAFIKPEKRASEAQEEQIKVIALPEMINIKDLADKMKLKSSDIIKKLFLQGKLYTVNSEVSFEEAEEIAMEYDILCEQEEKVDVIEELLKEEEDNEEEMTSRPPVICVMGHVDHGKTSLLDAIRKTNVIDREAGGITQHIGAYTVNIKDQKITFLDTPGHEAFTAMRMRGANSTDIAILVVAADDGVMPQTVEAINHAKAAGVEIIVAVNKIDKPSANIDRVKQELAEYELIPASWGGKTEFVPVSAKSGEGIEELLETILLTAEIMELKANAKRRARGLVIEAELDKGRGPVATVLVQKGTLHVGDFISAGASHGKVRAMIDDKGRRVKEATPSTPVEILGLSDVPSAGETFIAHDSDKTARSFAETYMAQNKEKKLEETKAKMSLDDLFNKIQEGNLKELNLVIKADVQGSVEAVKQSLEKVSNDEVIVKCIHGGVGAINESDVVLASASNAIIIGFNVRPDATAKATAEREGVEIKLYKIIYQAIEDVQAAMKGMLDPIFEEKVIGHAEVRQIFKASAIGNIAGSYVLDGTFQRDCKVRITREGEQIFEGALASLKRFKDDVKEVKAGFECGLVFDGFDQMQELDIVEAYIMVEVPR